MSGQAPIVTPTTNRRRGTGVRTACRSTARRRAALVAGRTVPAVIDHRFVVQFDPE
jgi:hypothetical protein